MENKSSIDWNKLLSDERFQEFMKKYELPSKIFNTESLEKIIREIPRYIRKTDLCKLTEEEFLGIFDYKAMQDIYLRDLYALPSDFKISNLEIYKNGSISGIDLSSAYVVEALNPKPDENILEICCAPGAKLLYTAQRMLIRNESLKGSLTGIDISSDRLNICKSLLKKYKFESKVKLIKDDATKFTSECRFDKILVDAECTHDGSLKHILKYMKSISSSECIGEKRKSDILEQDENSYFGKRTKKNEWSSKDFYERFLDQTKLSNIVCLQKELLKNAFSLLKEGSYLIYSTCSFSKLQNEDLIKEFINERNKEAELLPTFENENLKMIKCTFDSENGFARFDPFVSNSGGMFIAKIYKRINSNN